MLRLRYAPYTLHFAFTAVTSRASMTLKDTFFLRLGHGGEGPEGWGECALFRGLSREDTPRYPGLLELMCADISAAPGPEEARELMSSRPWGRCSSLRMGLETALADLRGGGKRVLWDSPFATGSHKIDINGLVWMGSTQLMAQRLRQKLQQGFSCVKLKIGGADFESELQLLRDLRDHFPAQEVEIRLDANGAFAPDEALRNIERLAPLGIHSLEQPIRPGQWREMARICSLSPIPVALDEELIGLHSDAWKRQMLRTVRPAYIILKPSLCGGFAQADSWIDAAREEGVGWWATSALESDLGLNAIAQWVALHDTAMPQGLGTGQLYTNNLPSTALRLRGASLGFDPQASFALPSDLQWQ